MRARISTVMLAVAGLLVAMAVGFTANAIGSRLSFTPGADALPSAGSLAPAAVPPEPTEPTTRAVKVSMTARARRRRAS